MSTNKEIITKIIIYINNNYKSIKNIDLLAQKCGLTKKYFITLFKQYTLETPHAYINQLRLIEGKKLLETTDLSITDIAKKIGFNSGNTFTKYFTKMIGVSPNIYRKGII